MIRKSITVDDENNENLNQLRGRLLLEKGIDLDFTRTVNMLIAMALYRIANTTDLPAEELNILNKYIFGFKELELEALGDEHWNKWIQYEYPKMIDQLAKMQKKSRKPKHDAQRREGALPAEG